MGLDNGIEVRGLELKEIPPHIRIMLPSIDYQEKYNPPTIEICYWRKCWNVRREIGEILEHHIENVFADDYNFDINKEILEEIKLKIVSMLELGKDSWEEDGESIWTFEEIKPSLEKQIEVIDWFLKFMEDNPSRKFEIEFYDSY